MPTRLEERKAELLARLTERLHERLEGRDALLADAFVRQYYRGVAPQDLVERDPLDLYGAALAHLRFGERRRPGAALVRVYNPQIEQHGWQSTHTIAEIVNDDMPFLVDSVAMTLNRRGLMIHLIIHPVIAVRRDGGGRLDDVLPDDGGAERSFESFMHVEVDRHGDPEVLAAIEADLRGVLAEVRIAVEDWKPMVAAVDDAIAELERGAAVLDPEELAEARALLRWIADHHFTFVGYACYDLVVEDAEEHLRRRVETGLGILRKPPPHPVSLNFATLPSEARRRALAPEPPIIITKANTRSPVHRPAHLDYIGVKRFDQDGRVIGEHRFLGLLTSAAYNRSPREIPVLRRKVARILAKSGLSPISHDGKALINILETYPRDELLQTPDAELFRIAQGILHLQDRQQIRLFMRRDAYGRFVVCQVFVPRERYNTELRKRMEAVLQEALGGTEVEFQTLIGESVLARILFTVRTPDGTFAEVDESELEARLVEAARSWGDVLREALFDAEGEEEGVRLYHAYGDAFPVAYREQVPAPAAVPDVLRIDRLARGQDDLVMSLYRPLEADPGTLRFKLGRAGGAIPLSDVLPVLENMGLRVIDEHPFEIRAADGRTYWLHDFRMVPTDDGPPPDLDRVRGEFQELFARVWRGDAENDGFNRLVLLAGLDWRRVMVLRAYCKYMLQIGSPFSQAYIEQTLATNPELATRFALLFDARFDPDAAAERAERCAALEAEIRGRLEAVVNLDEDRILRRYLHLLLATLRTNAFQRVGARAGNGGGAQPYLALKFDPQAIRDMPLPRPAFEIFLYSPRTEAVHLRGGKVARGGLRWSDRREDFRTEVLGLMKAQMVKNVVIVPVGAKGGFILKRPPKGGDRVALREEAVACYRTFMRGMLDITDNRVGGEVVPPERVVRYDGDDPYLVVAADKGTADFSDIANGVSESYGFWLGDAFASGGSQGYDHKGMGITARGAWESVKRMFYELGVDIEREPFTVVGIGDMSGDVFGNGMLLSEQIKLICAFDHRHIFIDPDPDPAVSYAERKRLFGLPRSSWDDYDRSKLSPGGGVYPRTVKSIPLSPEARAALGVDAAELSPPELIRAALTAHVDLLWNGGIGTFVKAADERHADAADRTNDAIRVNAEELRCRVVGEGGNLGFTQRARIAFARKGGRINTDFVDNSAGVDTSDHEVNIKILLNAAEQAGDITRKQRNELLAGMTDEVGALVLRDNVLQVLAISMAEAEAPQLLDAQAAQMRRLEAIGRLNRELELLPGDEALAERRKDGHGLTRPEIAVLTAYAKMDLYDELLASDLPDEPYFARDLVKYFPRPLRQRFRPEILEHRLRREIVATQLANGIVNRTLGAFIDELREETGCGAADVARAYIVARDAFELVPLWGRIEELAARTPADLQIDIVNEARHVLERGVRWFMRQLPQPIAIEATVTRFGPGIGAVTAALEEVLPPSGREDFHERARGHAEDGADETLARRLAALRYLVPACEVVAVAGETGVEVIEAARVYFALETGLHLDRLRALLSRAEQRSRWDRLALAALQDDVFRAERRLAVQALSNGAATAAERGEIEAWLARHGRGVERSRRLLAELEATPAPDVAMMSVAVRALDGLSAVDRSAA